MKKITLLLFAYLIPAYLALTHAEKKPEDDAKTDKQDRASEESEALPAATKEEQEIATLKTEIELLSLRKEKFILEQNIADEELRRKRTKQLRANEEAEFKAAQELAKTKREIQRLTTETELIEKLLAFESAQRKAKISKELADLRYKEEQLKAENDLYIAQHLKKVSELKQRDSEIKSRRLHQDYELAEVELKIKEHDKIDQLEGLAEREKIIYSKQPLEQGTLYISDRRITLNDAITYATADRVTERINFYNNKSHQDPIFIVIDYSPGGSVMSGYRILKAMKGSKAPVYVVVKSFAASMAAAITTLSDQSFAYPNAIILHHQMSYGLRGNMTQQKEMLEESQEWWKRLAGPIAAKMGVTLDEFIQQMYENDSGGDWVEFADKAAELKWVDHVVNEIRETSLLEHPDKKKRTTAPLLPIRAEDASLEPHLLGEQLNADGERFYRLPRLVPYDFYYLYNPDNYYRL